MHFQIPTTGDKVWDRTEIRTQKIHTIQHYVIITVPQLGHGL